LPFGGLAAVMIGRDMDTDIATAEFREDLNVRLSTESKVTHVFERVTLRLNECIQRAS